MPEDSFFRIDDEDKRERLLPVLHKLYKFESKKISGSHGGKRLFSKCIWTKEEVLDYWKKGAEFESGDDLILDEIIKEMSDSEQRHMIRFKKEGIFFHITRVAEIIRTTGNLHEFMDREQTNVDPQKYSIIEGAIWKPELRFAVRREISKEELIEKVRKDFSKDGSFQLSHSMGGQTLDIAIEDLTRVINSISRMKKWNGKLKFSEFQVEAIRTAFKQSWKENSSNNKLNASIITAGTGMGKTLGFAIPVITDALIINRSHESQNVCSQLLIYPRVDLAKDQFSEINNYIKYVNFSLIKDGFEERCIGMALDADGRISNYIENYPNSGQNSPKWGIGGKNKYISSSQAYGLDKPASIIACGVESFRRRLRIPEVVEGLTKGLRRIVWDEIHLSSGIQGAHHSKIVSRCRQMIYKNNATLNFIGVSATIAEPRNHVESIAGIHANLVEHIDSEKMNRDSPMSMMHHIMIRPRKGTPLNGALVDITSSVTHQRRKRDFYLREAKNTGGWNFNKLQKTIGFADSHEVVGEWHSLMRENESTSRANDRRYDTSDPSIQNLRRPYAHWHERPLRIHPLGDSVCGSCQKMNYSDETIIVRNDDIPKFKEYTENTISGENSSWDLPLFKEGEDIEVKGLDTCPHLEFGTCWWFSPRDSEAMEARPGDNRRFESFRDVIRVGKHTAKNKHSDEEEMGDSSANFSFRKDPIKGAYEREHWAPKTPAKEWIPHDLAVATPTLEVGVDMDNVSEVITHKAIRNISSYRQKVGRGGRKPGTDGMAVTLMSMGSRDFQHYRSMHRLVTADIVDPVPIAKNNDAVKKNAAYEAVFDYVTKHHTIELIPQCAEESASVEDWNEWPNRIKNAIGDICVLNGVEPIRISKKCDDYVKWASNLVEEEDYEIRNKAALIVAKHLGYFLEKTPDGATVIQWISSMFAQKKRGVSDPNAKQWKHFHDIVQEIDEYWQNPGEELKNILDKLKDSITRKSVENIRKCYERIHNLAPDDVGTKLLEIFVKKLEDFPEKGEFFAEVEAMKDDDDFRMKMRYISSVMYTCRIFLKDTPFSPLSSLFNNPHESPVEVFDGNRIIDKITNNEAMRYTLPGMWTHRLEGAERWFLTHTGDVDSKEYYFNMHLDNEDHKSPLMEEIKPALDDDEILKFPDILEVRPKENIDLYKLKSIKAQRDQGIGGNDAQVMGIPVNPNNPDPYSGLTLSVRSGNFRKSGDRISSPQSKQMKRPKAHPISWLLSKDSGEYDEIMTYKIRNAKPVHGGKECFPVTNHPLLNHIFENITYDKKIEIKKIVLGISRSNGPILVPTINQKNIAFIDKFNTRGIRFRIKKEFMETVGKKGESSEHPFDERILRMIGSKILSNDKIQQKPYRIKEYLDLMVDEAWRQSNDTVDENAFPKTNQEFVDLLFKSGNHFDRSYFEERAKFSSITIDEKVDQIRSDLLELHEEWGTHCLSDLCENLEINMKEWYCKTFLNSLGVILADSIAEMAGVQSGSIGYTYTVNGEDSWIDVIDNDPEGNGSIDLVKRYFHIPVEIRDLSEHFKGKRQRSYLPTMSFVEILEKNLEICQEHMIHSIAISEEETPLRIDEDMEIEAKEIRERFRQIWSELGISNTREASLHNRRLFSINQENRFKKLDKEIALSLCDVECPACVGDGFTNLFPIHISEFNTCRAVVDDSLGDWTKIEGYKRRFRDSEFLAKISGENVPSDSFINIKGKNDNELAVIQHFVNYPSPAVGFSWTRGMEVPNDIDFLVRHLEII